MRRRKKKVKKLVFLKDAKFKGHLDPGKDTVLMIEEEREKQTKD